MSMDLAVPDDLRQILDSAHSMLEAHYPVSRLRDESHHDPAGPLAEFGTFLLALPEERGGAGLSLVEEAQLHVAFGRHLVAPTAIAGAVAARIAIEADRADLTEGIAAGDVIVCAGVAGTDTCLLFDAEDASQALIRSGPDLILVDLTGDAPGPMTAMGHGRPVARWMGDLSRQNDLKASDAASLQFDLLVCAQLLGVATGARDLAVDYAKTREQFGQPIGSFQAIKHHCANMTIGAEMLSAQLDMAAIRLRDQADDAAFQVAALVRLAPRIALENARTGIQIHGGIGFSAEADAQLYLKQAHILRHLLGRTDFLALASPMAPTGKGPK